MQLIYVALVDSPCYTLLVSENQPIAIRASMLDTYNDCARLAAARAYQEEIADAGYTVRQLLPPVARAMGSALHSGMSHALTTKMEGRALTKQVGGECRDAVVTALTVELAQGAVWDDTTPRANVAEQQALQMLRSLNGVIAAADPIMVEQPLKMVHGDLTLTGNPDWVDRDGWIPDLKTGVTRRPHWGQLGQYSLLVRSQPEPAVPHVQGGVIVYVPRAAVSKPQPAPIIERYDVDDCERAAIATMARIERDVTAFRENGDADAFAPNPMSMICREKYCPAWGTDFCHYGRQD